ncbi:hypothetical protein ES708_32053 [subsurface metagenome]
MAKVKVVIPTGGNLPGTTSTATNDGDCLTIVGTEYVLVPIQVNGVTYYAIAAKGWAFVAKT